MEEVNILLKRNDWAYGEVVTFFIETYAAAVAIASISREAPCRVVIIFG